VRRHRSRLGGIDRAAHGAIDVTALGRDAEEAHHVEEERFRTRGDVVEDTDEEVPDCRCADQRSHCSA